MISLKVELERAKKQLDNDKIFNVAPSFSKYRNRKKMMKMNLNLMVLAQKIFYLK